MEKIRFMSRKVICLIVCLTFLLSIKVTAKELKVEDVISKHLASIGAAEKLKDLKNMMLLGSSEFESKLPQRKSVGKLAIVSNDSNLLFISSFLSDSYPFEKIGLFGGKIDLPFAIAGTRSPLGDFLFENPSVLENGLFSGSMSLKWLLFDKDLRKGKVRLAGTKKIGGIQTYAVDYFPRNASSDFKIKLYFDADTFRHIRSEYKEEFDGKAPEFPSAKDRTITGGMGQVKGFSIQLIESFSDFKTYENITLPSVSKIRFFGSSEKGVWEYDWTFRVTDVRFNQPLKEDFFKF